MKKSKFIENAAFRLKNRKWLRYSSNISRRILAEMEESTNMDRNVLADKLDVSRQYISKLLQGRENLSLQTIANISEALGVELITFPPYKDSYIRSINSFSISDYSNKFQEKFQKKIKEENKDISSKSKEAKVTTEKIVVYNNRIIAA